MQTIAQAWLVLQITDSKVALGTVTIAAADFEADLAPRPNGDKAVTITDWVLEGLFVARLEYPTNTGEFQRAD